METIPQDQIRTLSEVLEILRVWDLVFMEGKDHPLGEYIADLPWLYVIGQYLDGATPEQLKEAWHPDEVPDNYCPRPLQRAVVLEDMRKFVEHAWRFRQSPYPYLRSAGDAELDNDLMAIDAYLWLLKDEEAILERRSMLIVDALSWICERYGFPIVSE